MANADTTACYSFHGLGITVEADRPEIMVALHSRLRRLPVTALPATDPPVAGLITEGAADLRFTFRSTPRQGWTERPPGEGRTIYDALDGEVLYFAQTDQLYIDYRADHRSRVTILCDPALGEVRVSLSAGEEDLWPLAHILFTLPFVELLKRRGRYSLHAAGLCLGDRGLFLPGTSGSGKSTLSVALLRSGFDFMGDDLLFLSHGQEGLEVRPFPEDIDVTDGTVGFFPELRHLFAPSFAPSQAPIGPKRQLWPAQHYPVRTVATCRPALLVFPQVSPSGTTALTALDRHEAFLELVPNVLLTEARSSQAHLDAVAKLVRQSDCYRLEAGRDFDAIAARLRGLLSA